MNIFSYIDNSYRLSILHMQIKNKRKLRKGHAIDQLSSIPQINMF